MKLVLKTFFLFCIIDRTYGISCYVCSDSNYDGGYADNCFTINPAETNKANCSSFYMEDVSYCRTKFTIRDGVTTNVERTCSGSEFDEDAHTKKVPASDKCVTSIRTMGNPTSTTNCYFHCTDDNCNIKNTDSLKQCGSTCNRGSCNYITGVCVCDYGYTGDHCSDTTTAPVTTPTRASRRCVQCNSETDKGCSSSTTSVDCPGNEYYCSTTTSTIYDASYAVVHTVITRGCTSSYQAADECTFSAIHSDSPISDSRVGYKEYNCYSTCDADGCNTNTADGVINGNEAIHLQCVQCHDSIGSGTCNTQTRRETCPSGSTHCKSTVNYLIHDRKDRSYQVEPKYELLSVIRECVSAAVTRQCTETSVGTLSFKKVTCTETCQGDGCNTGWPARPKCTSCYSTITSENDRCLKNPPAPDSCSYPYEKYCYIQETGFEKGTRKSVEGYPRTIWRGCSYHNYGTGCSTITPRDIEIESCNRTCTTDGCNLGSGGAMLSFSTLSLLLSVVLGWIFRIKI